MNIKLIVGSILSIGSLGGATGYYLLKPENTTKAEDNTDSQTKSSQPLHTNKETTPDSQTQPNSVTNNLKPSELPQIATPSEPSPDSRPATSVALGVSGSSGVDNSSLQTTRANENVQRAVGT